MSAKSNESKISLPIKFIIRLYQSLKTRSDYEIEKKFLERLAANFDSVFKEEIKGEIKTFNTLDLDKSFNSLENEIVALFLFLYKPISEQHLSEEVIARPTRHRLLYACERLLELLDEFESFDKNPDERLRTLKNDHRAKLSEVLRKIALRTVEGINEHNAAQGGDRIQFDTDPTKLRTQLVFLIKAQYIGPVLSSLAQIAASTTPEEQIVKEYIESIISNLNKIEFVRSTEYVFAYLDYIRITIDSLLAKIKAKETFTPTRYRVLTCLSHFYQNNYSSEYSENRNCFDALADADKVLWKLNNSKYDLILKFSVLRKTLTPELTQALRTVLLSSPDLSSYDRGAIQLLTILEVTAKNMGRLNEDELSVLSFVNLILSELRVVKHSFSQPVHEHNQRCLRTLCEKLKLNFNHTSELSDIVAHATGICTQLNGIDAQIRDKNALTQLAQKTSLINELQSIVETLSGNENSSEKFIPTNDKECDELEKLKFLARNQSYIQIINKYKSKRNSHLFYNLYDLQYDDQKGGDKYHKTKACRFVAANAVIKALETAPFGDYSNVMKEIAKQISQINDHHSDLLKVLVAIANDIFQKVNVSSTPPSQTSSKNNSWETINTANDMIFNQQLLVAIGWTDDYQSYKERALSFRSPDVFSSHGLFSPFSNFIRVTKNTVEHKIQVLEFDRKLKHEYEQIEIIRNHIKLYSEYDKQDIPEFYTQLYILCNNAIMKTQNSRLHDELQQVKKQIELRFKPCESDNCQIRFRVSQRQRMRFSDLLISGQHDDTHRISNYAYLQQVKNGESKNKSQKNNNLEVAYDLLLSKINNHLVTEKVLATGKVQRTESDEEKLLGAAKNLLYKLGCPPALVTLATDEVGGYLKKEAKSKTVKIAKSVPLLKHVDEQSMLYAEKITDMYRYQIENLVEPHYLNQFIDVLVERFLNAKASGVKDHEILQHMYNNSQKHSLFGFARTNIGEIQGFDETSKNQLTAEDLIGRPGVVVFDKNDGTPRYYTLSNPYTNTACQYTLYGFVVLDQPPSDMRELSADELQACQRLPNAEFLDYFKMKFTIDKKALKMSENRPKRDATDTLEKSSGKSDKSAAAAEESSDADRTEELIIM